MATDRIDRKHCMATTTLKCAGTRIYAENEILGHLARLEHEL